MWKVLDKKKLTCDEVLDEFGLISLPALQQTSDSCWFQLIRIESLYGWS